MKAGCGGKRVSVTTLLGTKRCRHRGAKQPRANNSFQRYRSESQAGRRQDKTFGWGERGALCWQGYPGAKGQDGAGGAGVGYPHVSDTACPGVSLDRQ